MTEQSWDPERYARNAGFVARLGIGALELLDAKPGERILDLGCGDGALTEKIVSLGCQVVGVDGSAEQIAAARDRGLDVRVMNGQTLEFDSEFDAVFSNAALHWMTRPDAVIAGVRRALKVRGRFVGEFGGAGNIKRIKAAIEDALCRRGVDSGKLDPWYYPTLEEYQAKLEAAGFTVEFISLFDRPTELPGSLCDWLETFAEPFTSAIAAADRVGFREEVQEAARPHLCDDKGRWRADYVRLRFAAYLYDK